MIGSENNHRANFAGRDLPDFTVRVIGDLRCRVDGDVLALSVTSDGQILSVEDRGIFRRWDSKTGFQLESAAVGDTENVWAIAPNGKWLLGAGRTLTLWNLEDSPTPTMAINIPWCTAACFSPLSHAAATAHHDGTIRVWDVPSGELKATLAGPLGDVTAVAFSNLGYFLASAAENREVHIWGWEEEILLQTFIGHTDRIDALAWSTTDSIIATAAWDTAVRVWDVRTANLIAMLNGHGERVHAVEFLPPRSSEGFLVSGDCEHVVRIWDFKQLRIERELRRHRAAVKHIAIGSEGDFLATAGDDRCILLWNTSDFSPRFPADGPMSEIQALGVSGASVAAIHSEKRLSMWRWKDGVPIDTNDFAGVSALDVSPMGRWAFGFNDGKVRLAQFVGESENITWSSDSSAVRTLAFDRTGAQIAVAHALDGTVRFFDCDSGGITLVIPEASLGGSVEAISFHPTDNLFAVAGIDWKEGRTFAQEALVAEWRRRIPTAQRVVETRQPFHPEGAIVLWDTEIWAVRQVLEGGARRAVFHPNGNLLVAVSMDHSVLVWDHVIGELLHDFGLGESSAADVAFDSDGRWLVAGCRDGTLRIWDSLSWRQKSIVEMDMNLTAVASLSNGHFVVAGSNGVAVVVDIHKAVE